MAELLLAAGANVDTVDNDGWTPLHVAIENGYTETVKLLVNAGANVNAVDNDGYAPLHLAAGGGNTKVAKLLLAAPGIDVNAAENTTRRTPLHSAAEGGFTEFVKMLLGVGAKISVRDTEGRTALDLARERGRTEVANVIIAEDMIRLENRNKAGRIEKGRGIPTGLISQYLAFGRTKGRATIKRPVSKKKSMANKMGIAKLKKTARKLGTKQIPVRKKMVGKKRNGK